MRKKWYPAYIGLGSNLHAPKKQLAQALESIAKFPEVKVVSVSSFYQTEPYGGVEQEDFINAVAGLLTTLSPEDLLHKLQEVENQQGRVREQNWGPRSLDLDLLVYATEQRDSEFLILPHGEISKRDFVLIPLAEIASELMIVGLGRVSHLLARVPRNKIIKLGIE